MIVLQTVHAPPPKPSSRVATLAGGRGGNSSPWVPRAALGLSAETVMTAMVYWLLAASRASGLYFVWLFS